MVMQTGLMSLEEFLALPEEKPYLELIDGEVCQKPVGTTDHAWAARILRDLLEQYPGLPGGVALTDVGLPFEGFMPPNHRVPDLSYFRRGRPPGRPYPTQPPDLVAEVRSEGQTLASLERRLAFLRERGASVTLLIDTRHRRVYVHDGGREWTAGSGERVTIESLAGFTFAVDELFA